MTKDQGGREMTKDHKDKQKEKEKFEKEKENEGEKKRSVIAMQHVSYKASDM